MEVTLICAGGDKEGWNGHRWAEWVARRPLPEGVPVPAIGDVIKVVRRFDMQVMTRHWNEALTDVEVQLDFRVGIDPPTDDTLRACLEASPEWEVDGL